MPTLIETLGEMLDNDDRVMISRSGRRGVKASLPEHAMMARIYAAHGQELWDVIAEDGKQFERYPMEYLGGAECAASVNSPQTFIEHIVIVAILILLEGGHLPYHY